MLNEKKVGVVCFRRAYHGRTMGAQFMNNPSGDRNWIGYDDPNIHHINFPYPWKTDDSEAFFEDEMGNLLKQKGYACRVVISAVYGRELSRLGSSILPKKNLFKPWSATLVKIKC